MSLILRAARYATEKHAGQYRKYTNQPYITHPCRVAGRMAIHPLASESLVAAAFLHDTIEDCGVTAEMLLRDFNADVAAVVQWMTNISKPSGKPRAVRKQMDRDRIAGAPDAIKVLKLIDRIDNLGEIDTRDDFALVYADESRLLGEVIGSADVSLANELYLSCAAIYAAQ